jgi:hydrogenase-4 component E
MTTNAFTSLIDLAAGGLLLTAALIVWRHELPAIVRLLALQGAALALIPIVRGVHENDRALMLVGIVVLILRGLVMPWLLSRAIGAEPDDHRESKPLVNTTAALLIVSILTGAGFAVGQPVVDLDPGPTTNAAPAALSVVLIALFVMVTRRNAISQAAGFLMLDNAVTATAFLLTAGVPLIVELGASLDVFFAVIVIGILTGRLRRSFGNADLDGLQELHE